MKPRPNRLNQREKGETEVQQQSQQTQEDQVFESVEELVSHDLRQTKVPASIEQRLAESLASEKSPWWRKWLPKSR